MHEPLPSPLAIKALTGGVLVLTLNNPARRNSLSEAMMAALMSALDAIRQDRAIRVCVLKASGTVFCAGHDLKELSARRADPDRGRAYFTDIMGRCSRLMQAIVTLPQPVIAQVDGVATAAGCQLVASCDLAMASTRASFATPGVNIGLFCSTPMVALSRNLTRKHAMEMLLTGDMVSAEEARRMGLVNRVVEPDLLDEETLALARKIASKSALTVKIGKEAFYRQCEMTMSAAYDYAATVMVDNMLARDAEEGIGAFLEKRPPQWEDR
jgi:enoyl-CoA hydratase/carnithine racemase